MMTNVDIIRITRGSVVVNIGKSMDQDLIVIDLTVDVDHIGMSFDRIPQKDQFFIDFQDYSDKILKGKI
jgi:hypothetical protein